MSEHRYDIRISESCVDKNHLMVERQDPDNFTRFQTRERCALEIAAYVFKHKMNFNGNLMYMIFHSMHFRKSSDIFVSANILKAKSNFTQLLYIPFLGIAEWYFKCIKFILNFNQLFI